MSIREYYFKHIAGHIPVGIHGALHRMSIARSNIRRAALRNAILAYYDAVPQQDRTKEQDEVLSYLRSNSFSLVPYGWCREYMNMPVRVYKDRSKKLNYAVIDDKKIYFRRYTDQGIVRRAVRELSCEQDPRSPHRYVTDENRILGTLPAEEGRYGHFVRPGDIVADVGAADGIFSLSIADTASHIYLFECDPDWIPALEETFRDYSGKVTLVQKFVSDAEDDNSITLDGFFKGKGDISFLKADIESAEPKMLRGARELLKTGRIQKASVCVYHDMSHPAEFEQIFKDCGYRTRFTDGLMLNRNKPFMLKGVLLADLKDTAGAP
ncbi:MAG: FkbM family methyltransferase [Clostridiales bacterium]|nr:FkbM family methyltransferase [Clostridiales bacterium]